MYAFSLAADIDAPPARVWRALCDPLEVVAWDSGVTAALDAPADYPRPGQHVRWRYATGPFRILHDRPQEVVPERRLRSLLAVGPFRFDETYTLSLREGGSRLGVEMVVRLPLPVVGPLAERLYLGPRARTDVDASLQSLKRHCEMNV